MGLFSSLWSVVGAVLFALYLITCWVLWFALFRRQGITTAVIYVLLSMVLSHCITWFILGMEGVRATWALLSVVVFSAISLLEGLRKLPAEGRALKEAGSLASMLVRFALVTFVFGLSYMYAITINGLDIFHSVFSWALFVSALILLALVLAFQRRMTVGTLFSLAVPTVIAGLLITLFTDFDHTLLFILFNFGYFTYFVFIVILHCGLAKEHAVNEVRLACLLVASIFTGLFVGRLLFPAVELAFTQRAQDYQPLVSLLVICVLTLCMMVCLRSMYQLFGDFKKSLGFKRIGINEHKALSCEQIAQSFGLSERETEVLQLLLEEKTAAQIAEELVVAPGTAKAHIGNVYKKIDIHRREELFKIAANGLSDTRP